MKVPCAHFSTSEVINSAYTQIKFISSKLKYA